jgi:16S rRNA processing protein RimM
MQQNSQICIGLIRNTHGLDGTLKVEFNLPGGNFFEDLIQKEIFVDGVSTPFLIEEASESNNCILVNLHGIDSIEKAEKLKGKKIFVTKDSLKPLPEGEFLIEDLLNCEVYDFFKHEKIGKLSEFLDNPGNPVLKIKTQTEQTFLIPFVEKYIKSIDIKNKKIELADWEIFA